MNEFMLRSLFCSLSFTSSHHLLLHTRMCSDCAAISDTMRQQSSGTCTRAKLFRSHFTASSYKVSPRVIQLCQIKIYLNKRKSRISKKLNHLY